MFTNTCGWDDFGADDALAVAEREQEAREDHTALEASLTPEEWAALYAQAEEDFSAADCEPDDSDEGDGYAAGGWDEYAEYPW